MAYSELNLGGRGFSLENGRMLTDPIKRNFRKNATSKKFRGVVPPVHPSVWRHVHIVTLRASSIEFTETVQLKFVVNASRVQPSHAILYFALQHRMEFF